MAALMKPRQAPLGVSNEHEFLPERQSLETVHEGSIVSTVGHILSLIIWPFLYYGIPSLGITAAISAPMALLATPARTPFAVSDVRQMDFERMYIPKANTKNWG